MEDFSTLNFKLIIKMKDKLRYRVLMVPKNIIPSEKNETYRLYCVYIWSCETLSQTYNYDFYQNKSGQKNYIILL